MHIAVDFDDTITLEPVLFSKMIKLFRSEGHHVHIVTARHPITESMIGVYAFLDENKVEVDSVNFTAGKAKKDFMYERGIHIQVWMDDSPYFILNDAPQWYRDREGNFLGKLDEESISKDGGGV